MCSRRNGGARGRTSCAGRVFQVVWALSLGFVSACSERGVATLAEVSVGALSEAAVGELLFHDTQLSAGRSQACASCHDPERAFVDPRAEAASLGDDGASWGDRNAPSAAYARFCPSFREGTRRRFNTDSDIARYTGFIGGQFHDGRAPDLEAQAAGPFLNPIEMGMPDEASVVSRLLENEVYASTFVALYGPDIWDEPSAAYKAMTKAIAAFERTEAFAPFDSRYDRSLLALDDARRYEYDPASLAAYGKSLFFSAEFTNCAACHQLHAQGSRGAVEEVFSGFEYHNLGVPENVELRERNGGAPIQRVDLGLGAVLEDPEQDGKFKTPSLRNVAVTAPYMHNGVFRELKTVLRFYEHSKLRARDEADSSLNPETGEPWRAPEVERNISRELLASGNKALDEDRNVAALECFLLSLTDARYEALLDPVQVVETCGL